MDKLQKKPLGEIMTLHRGYDLPHASRIQGNFPVISSSGISGSHNEYKVDGPNVITGRYGTIGEVFFHDGPCWPLNTALYVSDFHGNDPRYAAYLLELMLASMFSDGTDKSTVPGIDRNVIHQLVAPFVESATRQRETIAPLVAIDAKIANNKKLMGELEATARLIYDYWFTQFDFPDEDGKPHRSSGGKMVWSDELKREIPKGWHAGTLQQVARLVKETVTPEESKLYEHYSIPAFDSGHYPSFETGDQIDSDKYRVGQNCILYSKLNPKFKRLWRPLMTTKNAICSTEFLVIEPRDEVFSYVLSVLDSDAFYAHMASKAISSTGSRARVDPDVAMGFGIAIPPIEIIRSFSTRIASLQDAQAMSVKEDHELCELRDWLLPMLMSGQAQVED